MQMRARHAGMRTRIGAIALAGLLCAFPATAADGERRGSAPPGTGQDGSRPAEGAIKGGSMEAQKKDGASEPTREELVRCRDLTGTLRAQCLADARKESPPAAPKK